MAFLQTLLQTSRHASQHTSLHTSRRLGITARGSRSKLLAALLSITLLFTTSLTAGLGAPKRITEYTGATDVRGYLSGRQDRHYLGLQPESRFGVIRLTLTLDPAIPLTSDDEINFLVLTETGLQRFLNGAEPWEVSLAAGVRLQESGEKSEKEESEEANEEANEKMYAHESQDANGGDAGNAPRFSAEFRTLGRGAYTVIVYGTGDTPAAYHLHVEGGRLIDDAGQTLPVARSLAIQQLSPRLSLSDLAQARLGNARPALATLPVASLGRPAALPLRAQALSGLTGEEAAYHYFLLEPTAANSEMTLSLTYDTAGGRGRDQLDGFINFWVLTEEGLRQVDQGASAEFLSLASGVSFLGVPNLLRTKVRLTHTSAYAIVVYNDANQPAQYRLRVEGGELVDLYAQSHEAALHIAQHAGEETALDAAQPDTTIPGQSSVLPEIPYPPENPKEESDHAPELPQLQPDEPLLKPETPIPAPIHPFVNRLTFFQAGAPG